MPDPGVPYEPTDPNISGAFPRQPMQPPAFTLTNVPNWLLYIALAGGGGGIVGGVGDFLGNGEVNRRIDALEKDVELDNRKLDAMNSKLYEIERSIVEIETIIRLAHKNDIDRDR